MHNPLHCYSHYLTAWDHKHINIPKHLPKKSPCNTFQQTRVKKTHFNKQDEKAKKSKKNSAHSTLGQL